MTPTMPSFRHLAALNSTGNYDGPAIGVFLGFLESDIREGRKVRALPEELTRAMLANVGYAEDLGDAINGEVAL
jgi:antitoxin PrlF